MSSSSNEECESHFYLDRATGRLEWNVSYVTSRDIIKAWSVWATRTSHRNECHLSVGSEGLQLWTTSTAEVPRRLASPWAGEGSHTSQTPGVARTGFPASPRSHVRATGGGTGAHSAGRLVLGDSSRFSSVTGQTLLPVRELSTEEEAAADDQLAPFGRTRVGPRCGELPRNGGVPGIAPAPGPTRIRNTDVRAAKPKRPPGTASLQRVQYQLGEGGSVCGSGPMISDSEGRSRQSGSCTAPRRSREGGGAG